MNSVTLTWQASSKCSRCARRTEYPIDRPGALKSLDHGALLRSSETLRKNAAARNAAELTYLATPVKSVLLLPSAEVNYSVRSPKLGSATLENIHALPDS